MLNFQPHNILLSNDKKTLKIVDFGMAVKLDSEEMLIQKLVGTPIYMAPEMLSDQHFSKKVEKCFSIKCQGDIWSLGCCLYFLFTGERPYTHVKLLQKLENLLKKKNPIEAGREETVDSIKTKHGLYEFLNQCLNRDPMHRPTAIELLKDPLFGR